MDKIYGFNFLEKVKFETTLEKILNQINTSNIFSDDEYFYVLEEDRDFHFDEMFIEANQRRERRGE